MADEITFPLPSLPERHLKMLTYAFLLKYGELELQHKQILRNFDSEEYRQWVRQADPQIAQRFEQLTDKDHVKAAEQLAMVEAAAYTIRYAFELWGNHPR